MLTYIAAGIAAAILLGVLEVIKAGCRLFDQMLLALVADETRETQE